MIRFHLRSQRRMKGWTNEQTAQKIGVTKAHYNKLELGTKNPSIQVAFKLAALFECSVEDLFNDVFTAPRAM